MQSINLPQHSVGCRQGIDPWLKLHLSTLYSRNEFAFIVGHIEEWMFCRRQTYEMIQSNKRIQIFLQKSMNLLR